MAKFWNPVNWFEIPATDLAQSKAFYESVLDIELTEMEMGPKKMAWFPMEQDAPGAAGTLVLGESYTPSLEGSLVYFGVPSIEAALEKVDSLGGKTLMPKTPIGEHGSIAHFQDCAGNRVALHQKP